MQTTQTIAPVKEVIFIDANPLIVNKFAKKQLRVAAYCRVSTDSDEQATSYETQQIHYKEKIRENKDWRLVDIYAEEVSGTRADKRVEFQKMIKKCRKKQIDLIITKSISRFARNTVDCLEYIRELKALGIGVIFEKENINTLEAKSEVILTILSSLAQDESNSISANVKLGLQMRAKNGHINFMKTYGFNKDKDKNITIISEQAEVVKLIYRNYLAGCSERKIKQILADRNIPSPTGKADWSISTIQGMLVNEKYCGDIMSQKTTIRDPISKKVEKNNGQLPKVLIKNNHIPIISREEFERTQIELARRSSKKKVSVNAKTELGKFSGKYALTEIMVCGECNSPYRRISWTRKNEKKIVWRCLSRLESGTKYCTDSPTITEKDLQNAIVKALNETKQSREKLINYLIEKLKSGYEKKDTGEDKIAELEKQISELKTLAMDIVKENLLNKNSDDSYKIKLEEINQDAKTLSITLNEIRKSIASKGNLEHKLMAIKEMLSNQTETLTEYDDNITRQCIEQIKVISKEKINIIFKDGYEYEVRL